MKKQKRDEQTWARAYIRAHYGKPSKMGAHVVARNWICGLQDLCSPTLSQEDVNWEHNRLHRMIVKEVVKALTTSNADFFRDFADCLEQQGRNWCEQRSWLVRKHHPPLVRKPHLSLGKKLPSFTHQELLDDADANHISISDRQLRRLMRELGFKFKHSRRQ